MRISITKRGAVVWTKVMVVYLKANHTRLSVPELADSMGLKTSTVRKKCHEIGLYKMQMEYWTDEQVDFLMAYYTILGDVEMAEVFQLLYPKGKVWTCKHIEKKRKYLGLNRTKQQITDIRKKNAAQGRYATAKHWWPAKARKEGETCTWRQADGYRLVMIKWSGGSYNGGTYESLARIIWMLHYGPIPEDKIVSHIDEDSTNCAIENLKLMTRSAHAFRNRDHEKARLSLLRTYEVDRIRMIYGMEPKTKTFQRKRQQATKHVRALITEPNRIRDL